MLKWHNCCFSCTLITENTKVHAKSEARCNHFTHLCTVTGGFLKRSTLENVLKKCSDLQLKRPAKYKTRNVLNYVPPWSGGQIAFNNSQMTKMESISHWWIYKSSQLLHAAKRGWRSSIDSAMRTLISSPAGDFHRGVMGQGRGWLSCGAVWAACVSLKVTWGHEDWRWDPGGQDGPVICWFCWMLFKPMCEHRCLRCFSCFSIDGHPNSNKTWSQCGRPVGSPLLSRLLAVKVTSQHVSVDSAALFAVTLEWIKTELIFTVSCTLLSSPCALLHLLQGIFS